MYTELERLALRVREHIIRMSTDGGCFIGASLSCADLLVYLYARVLSISPSRVNDLDRDYLLLSKGHDVPALYGTLAELGYIPRERLRAHLSVDDHLYWHPNRSIPGVEFHSGSLGHLLAVGIGIAMDIRLRGGRNRVFVILGDGELNEGSVWESLLVAAAKGLSNLVVVVDRNSFQANVETEQLIPLESLEDKFRAFRWTVKTIDGHRFDELEQAFANLQEMQGPHAVIARTVRGKGLPSIERRADRWFANFTHDEIAQLLAELHQGDAATLTSQTMIVR